MKSKIIFISLFLTACDKAPDLMWKPILYAGDSQTQSIVRQNGEELEIIKTSNPQFDSMLCFDNKEIRKLQDAINQLKDKCQSWKP